MKLDILAFGSHPDDVELGCGGTLAKEINNGKTIGIIDLTRGELGTRGSAEIRDQESKDAATILGISVRENLRFADGFFVNDQDHQIKVIEKIRKYRPDIIICNAVRDRHIDHAKGSDLVTHACFLSGLVKIETKDKKGKSQEPWRPKQVYHYIQWMNIKPDLVVDISGFMDEKFNAIMAYKSQFFDESNKNNNTPISSKTFKDSWEYRARDLGRLVGVDHAEGFTVERLIAVDSLFDIK